MSNNNQQEKSVESEIKKPIETQVAAAWARQALAALPALPAIEPGDAMDRVERTREDVANLLTALAAEMDAEGGAA